MEKFLLSIQKPEKIKEAENNAIAKSEYQKKSVKTFLKNYDKDFHKDFSEDKPKSDKSSKPKLRPLTKKELEIITELEKKLDENHNEYEIFKNTKKKNGRKVPINKQTAVDNDFINNNINWRREIQILKAQPEIEFYIKEIKKAYREGEISKEQMDDMIYGTEKSLTNELDLYRRNLKEKKEIESKYNAKKDAEVKKMYSELNLLLSKGGKNFTQQKMYDIQPALYKNDYDKAKSLIMDIYNEIGMPVKQIKKRGRPSKVEDKKITDKINRRLERYERNEPLFKEQDIQLSKTHKELLKEGKKISMDKDIGTIMKGKSDLTKSKVGKYIVNTELKVKKDLNTKIKKALKQSILTEVDKKFKGSGIKKIELDYSSDDMFGTGYESESDNEDNEQYSKILKHLIGHITNEKEKVDKTDVKQVNEILSRIIKKRKHKKN